MRCTPELWEMTAGPSGYLVIFQIFEKWRVSQKRLSDFQKNEKTDFSISHFFKKLKNKYCRFSFLETFRTFKPGRAAETQIPIPARMVESKTIGYLRVLPIAKSMQHQYSPIFAVHKHNLLSASPLGACLRAARKNGCSTIRIWGGFRYRFCEWWAFRHFWWCWCSTFERTFSTSEPLVVLSAQQKFDFRIVSIHKRIWAWDYTTKWRKIEGFSTGTYFAVWRNASRQLVRRKNSWGRRQSVFFWGIQKVWFQELL